MTRKSFTVGQPKTEEIPYDDQIWFDLNGFDRKGQAIDPIPFRCMDEIQGTALTDTMRAAQQGVQVAAGEITEFIEKCLYDDEVKAHWDEIVRGKDVIIPVETLGEIMFYLMETYADRPTTKPSGSGSGHSITVPTSMANGQSQGLQTPQNSPYPDTAMPYTQ